MLYLKAKYSIAGNALFLILIAVALFATLSYAVTQSSRGSGSINKEKAILTASELLNYAAGFGSAVTRLRLTGCTEDEISVEATGNSGYTNSNAPTDNTCDVFEPEGGGLTWQDPPVDAMADTSEEW